MESDIKYFMAVVLLLLTMLLLLISTSLLADTVVINDEIVSIPEASTFALLGLGIAGLVLAAISRKK